MAAIVLTPLSVIRMSWFALTTSSKLESSFDRATKSAWAPLESSPRYLSQPSEIRLSTVGFVASDAATFVESLEATGPEEQPARISAVIPREVSLSNRTRRG